MNEEITLKEVFFKAKNIFRYLISKLVIILVISVIGGILGFTYASFQKPEYIATTSFVLEDGNSSLAGGLGGLASIAGFDIGNRTAGIFQGDNLLALYKSRTMIEKTLFSTFDDNGQDELFINRYIEIHNLRLNWEKDSRLKNIKFESSEYNSSVSQNSDRLKDSIVGVIVNDINANFLTVWKPDKKLSIIKAEVKARDEAFAKNFNVQIVKNVNDFYIQTKTKRSLENIQILAEKTDSVRSVLNRDIYKGASALDATPNINPSRQAKRTVPTQRAQVSMEANQAILSELVKNLEISKMSLLKELPLIQVIDGPVYPLNKSVFGKQKGVLVGSFLFGFLSVVFFILKRIYNSITTDQQ